MRSNTGPKGTHAGGTLDTAAANRYTTTTARRASPLAVRRPDSRENGEGSVALVGSAGAMSEPNPQERSGAGREIHRAHHDIDGREPTTVTIIKAIACVTDQDPLELPPLREAVRLDLDALDDLFVHGPNGHPSPETCLRFQYVGHVVLIYGDGRVSVRRPPGQE
jgi:hypothetical protein